MALKSDLVASIVRVLSPYIGETMARSATEAHCQKLGMDDAHVSRESAEALIGRLGAGLNVFVGRERSALVVEELKRAIAPEGRGQ
jgi:hypothetical protein